MKNRIIDSIGKIDDDMIESVDALRHCQKSSKKKNTYIKWCTVAACLCIAAASAFILPKIGNTPKLPDPVDPQPLPGQEISSAGMGFEGYLCHDISELNNGNPWSENMTISELPVYKNGAYDESGAGIPKGLSKEEMMKHINVSANALKLDVVSVEVFDAGGEKTEGEIPAEIRAKTNKGTIIAYANGGITYFLPDGGVELPSKYSFTFSDTTEDEAESVLSYLLASYKDFVAMDEPMAFSRTAYNFNGGYSRWYSAYDASGSNLEDILNYNFKSVGFFPSDSGKLSAIRTGNSDGIMEKLGDYPIISIEEAKKCLAAGKYKTNVPFAFPGEEYLGKVELVYRSGSLEKLIIPYYRFYVLLPDMTEGSEAGLKNYGAYYVPAISDEYISDLTTQGGKSN